MTEENPLGKLWEDNVEVELRVVLPPKLVGGDGLKIQNRQYIPTDFMYSGLTAGISLEQALDMMARLVISKVQEEVERGTER